jgi:hypothetical protein
MEVSIEQILGHRQVKGYIPKKHAERLPVIRARRLS